MGLASCSDPESISFMGVSFEELKPCVNVELTNELQPGSLFLDESNVLSCFRMDPMSLHLSESTEFSSLFYAICILE